MEMSAAQIVASLSRISAQAHNWPQITARDVLRLGSDDHEKLELIRRTVETYWVEVAPSITTLDDKHDVNAITGLYKTAFGPNEPKPICVVDYLQIIPDDGNPTVSKEHGATPYTTWLCSRGLRAC